jgi:hypothetical protein
MSTVAQELQVYEEIKAKLLVDNPDLDDQTLLDTLEGACDLTDRITNICRAAVEADLQAEVVGQMIKNQQARKKRHEERSERLRSLALWAMQEAGIPKIPAADITIAIGKGRASVVITDDTALPLEFTEFVAEPDKAKIKEALDAGQTVPGAHLNNAAPALTIRTR